MTGLTPTWGTCTPRGTFAYLKEYIYCTAATLNLRHKNGVHLYSSENMKVLIKFQWIFVILLSFFVIRYFGVTCPSVEMLKGYMVTEKLGTPELRRHESSVQLNQNERVGSACLHGTSKRRGCAFCATVFRLAQRFLNICGSRTLSTS